jgi:hypothetical protein
LCVVLFATALLEPLNCGVITEEVVLRDFSFVLLTTSVRRLADVGIGGTYRL